MTSRRIPEYPAGYARISRDHKGEQAGVDRQIKDINKRARQLGWPEPLIFVDNDITAAKRSVQRPEYDKLMLGLTDGTFDGLIIYDLDRFTRQPRQLEDFIDASEARRIELENICGFVDLSTSNGRMMARIKGVLAKQEAERTSERLERHYRGEAEKGKPKPGRFRTFGYTRDFQIIPAEAEMIKDGFKRVVAGESLTSIAADWTAGDIKPVSGSFWRLCSVRQILMRKQYCGAIEYNGSEVAYREDLAILDRELWQSCYDVLTDKSRSTGGKNARKHLLSTIARCGLCGAGLRVLVTKYICDKKNGGCGRIAVLKDPVDAHVEALIIRALEEMDLSTPQPEDTSATEMAALEAELAELRQANLAGQLALGDFIALSGPRRDRIAELQASRRKKAVQALDANVAAKYRSMSLSQKRAVITKVLTHVVIHPVLKRGANKFDPKRIEIVW